MTTGSQFAKRAIPVTVEFAQTPGQLDTLEGTVQYLAGDALLTGIQGERWTVRRAKFDSTYEAATSLHTSVGDLYVKRFIPVTAYQVQEETSISMQARSERLRAKPGDWVVTAPNGDQWVVEKDIFLSTYIAINKMGEAR